MIKLHVGLISWLVFFRDLFVVHFFLDYINDLSDDSSLNPKFLAEDATHFSVLHDENFIAKDSVRENISLEEK